MDATAIGQWLAVLDQLSYYDMFRLTPHSTHDEIRSAFHEFAEVFHPDGHTWRPVTERNAIGFIFRRATEAYRILAEPGFRARYDEALANGILQPETLVIEFEAPRTSVPPAAKARLIDTIRSPGARPFVIRAEELAKVGDPKQAKIQLVMAMHMDAKNPALEAYAKELDEAIQTKVDDEKKNWKKP